MESPNLKKVFVFLLLAVPVAVVFGQERVLLLGIPWYIPEIFVIGALGGFLFFNDSRWCFFSRRNFFLWGFVLMAIGFFLSILFNDVSPHGYGRLKSWFFFPVLYGVMLSYPLRKGMLSSKGILCSVFLSGMLFGISTLGSIFSGSAFSYDHRLHGFFSSPNQLAMILGIAILIGGFLGVSFWRERRRDAMLFYSGALFLLTLLLLTQSYMVTFSLVAVVGIAMFRYSGYFSRKQRGIFSLGLVLFIGTLLFLSPDKWQGIRTMDERSSLASRGMIWSAASRMIVDHPIIGIGPGNFQDQYLAYQRYFPPYLEWSAPHPHNMFLDIWLEGGLLAFTGFTMLILYWLLSSARYFWQKKNEGLYRSLPFLLALYFLLIGLTDVPFLRNDFAYFFVTAFVISIYEFRGVSDKFSHHDD